jgi:hypothetical protein
MDNSKNYKFDFFHRNSFDDEEKKRKKWLYIFITFVILFFAFVFIRTNYLSQIQFEEKIEGILLTKKMGSRNVFYIEVYNSKDTSSSEYGYQNKYGDDNISSFEKLQIGDSLFKQFNSHVVHIYRKGKSDSYVFFGSFY